MDHNRRQFLLRWAAIATATAGSSAVVLALRERQDAPARAPDANMAAENAVYGPPALKAPENLGNQAPADTGGADGSAGLARSKQHPDNGPRTSPVIYGPPALRHPGNAKQGGPPP